MATITIAGRSFEVRTFDISAGGMGLVASANPLPGTLLQVTCSIPIRPKGLATLSAQGRVTHSIFGSDEGGFKIGVSFTHISPETAALIVNFLS